MGIDKPLTRDAWRLLMEGSAALGKVEATGICVDVPYLERTERRLLRKIGILDQRCLATEVGRRWTKRFGAKTNLQSARQLSIVLFDVMGFSSNDQTAGGSQSSDEDSLSTIDDPFIPLYLKAKKLRKAAGTYVCGLLREVVDGKIHPFFHLHNVTTYRGSSSDPNFQNIPVRDPEVGRLVRAAIVPRKGRRLVEIDISGAEVRVAACYHKDPRMIGYIKDKTKDMHRDMASEIYKLPMSDITKDIRFCAKSYFVFAQFYGDWYKDCAHALWHAVEKMGLNLVGGVSLRDHLTQQGFTELGACDPKDDPEPGTFEEHIQRIERRFWERRFPVYAQWKKKWFEQYRKRGWLQMLTGFVCKEYLKRNEAINRPVQGSAFHCLLWALIEIVLRELPKRRMKAKVVGQIHDSLVGDVPDEEVDDYVALCNRVMTVDLPKAWDWLIVPMEVEAEVCPVGGTWADKKPYKIKA